MSIESNLKRIVKALEVLSTAVAALAVAEITSKPKPTPKPTQYGTLLQGWRRWHSQK